MSIPKERLHELVELIPDEKSSEVLLLLETYLEKQKTSKNFDPSKYRGMLKHLNIDIEEECKKMRDEWVREWEQNIY